MRAAVLTDDHTFVVEQVPDPTPGPGDLVVRVEACGICGSDLKAHGHMPGGIVMGHEFCGEVVAVGADLSGRWREGELLAALRSPPAVAAGGASPTTPPTARPSIPRASAVPRAASPSTCGSTPVRPSACARTSATSAPWSSRSPSASTPSPPAASARATGARHRWRQRRFRRLHLGPALRRRGGRRQRPVAHPPRHRRPLRRHRRARPGEGPPPSDFDVVVECVGIPGLIQVAMDAAAVRGRVVVAGVCITPDPIMPLTGVLKELEVGFAVYYRKSEFAAAAALLESGDIDPATFVTGRVGLDGVASAFTHLLSSDTERKILVTPGAGT